MAQPFLRWEGGSWIKVPIDMATRIVSMFARLLICVLIQFWNPQAHHRGADVGRPAESANQKCPP